MITVSAVAVAVAATILLVLADRNQIATNERRRRARAARLATRLASDRRPAVPVEPSPGEAGFTSASPLRVKRTVVPYRPPRWYRRIGALFGLGVTAVVSGALLAIAVGIVAAIAYFLLKQAVG